MWDINDLGFLPSTEPITSLSIVDWKSTELVYTWENLIQVIPHYIKEECAREEIVCTLRRASQGYYHGFVDGLIHTSNFERTFLILAYIANVYVNAPEGKRKSKLVKEITVPFSRVGHLVGRHPVIDYTSFVLYNWKRKDKTVESLLGNVEPLHSFTDSDSEKAIITSLVEVEYLGRDLQKQSPSELLDTAAKINEFLANRLDKIDIDFLATWNHLTSDYENLLYEQWKPEPISFACDLGLQSPIVAFFCKKLDIKFQNDYLGKKLQASRPAAHIQFLNRVTSVRDAKDKETYNKLLDQLVYLYSNLAFREEDKRVVKQIECELNDHRL